MTRIFYYLASFVAVICVFCPHEFAHAYVAYKNGDPTAKFSGRMTLNPLKHFDLVGFILCALVGFGWAKPVPINPSNFRKYKMGMFTTAIAGVVVNYIIAFFVYALYLVAYRFLSAYTGVSYLAMYAIWFLQYVLYLIYAYSLYSFVFNLLPLFPLDGFRVVEAFTRQLNPVRRFLRNYGQMIIIILVAESFMCNLAAEYQPIFDYFNVLNYVGYFAREIVGFPIKAAWGWILTV